MVGMECEKKWAVRAHKRSPSYHPVVVTVFPSHKPTFFGAGLDFFGAALACCSVQIEGMGLGGGGGWWVRVAHTAHQRDN